jgi:hypothetical protein
MNILHVLSGDLMTGSETSTAAFIRRQAQKGHQVFIAAGSFSQPVPAKFIPLPIYNRGFLSRLRNIRALAGLIRREKIDLVHAHSRAASWVSHWACRLTKTAILSTLHGRQHLHFSNRHFNVYGPRCVAVCENIREQMLEETNVFKPEQLVVVRNGIELKSAH